MTATWLPTYCVVPYSDRWDSSSTFLRSCGAVSFGRTCSVRKHQIITQLPRIDRTRSQESVLAICAERDCATSSMRRRNEHVADTPDGADSIGVSRVKFYLAAQTGNP